MSRLIALGCLIISLLAHVWNLRPLDDGDLFTHIVVGRWLPDHAILTETERPTQTFISWLSYLILAKVDEYAGLAGVKALNLFILASSFLMLFLWQALAVSRQSAYNLSVFGLAAGLISAHYVSASNTSARPQSFAYLSFCALLLALEIWSADRKSCSQRSVILFALLTFWQNCHPSLVLAIPVIAVYIAYRGTPRWFIVLPLVAMISTPDGWSIFSVSAYNLTVSRDLLQVSEWMPPWHPSLRSAMEPFWVVALLSIIGGAISRNRPFKVDPVLGILSAIFLILTLTSSRFGSFWGFVHAPLFGELARAVWPGKLATVCISRISTMRYAILTCISTTALWLNPGAILPEDQPIHIFRSLRKDYPHARIFNYREFGGALEYVGYPEWKVFIDGRLYLFDRKTWDTYRAAALVDAPTLIDALIDNHDLFVLDNSYHSILIKALLTSKRVTRVINQSSVVVFARNPRS